MMDAKGPHPLVVERTMGGGGGGFAVLNFYHSSFVNPSFSFSCLDSLAIATELHWNDWKMHVVEHPHIEDSVLPLACFLRTVER